MKVSDYSCRHNICRLAVLATRRYSAGGVQHVRGRLCTQRVA